MTSTAVEATPDEAVLSQADSSARPPVIFGEVVVADGHRRGKSPHITRGIWREGTYLPPVR